MASYNKVLLMGNLTRDPEMKFLPSGAAVCNFGIAINEKWGGKGDDEEVKESVCFVEIEAWERQAEVVNEYMVKGSPIFIEGALKFDSWETPEGEKRSRLKVRLIRFQFIGGNQNGEDGSPEAVNQASDTTGIPQTSGPQNGSQPPDNSDASPSDDIPF